MLFWTRKKPIKQLHISVSSHKMGLDPSHLCIKNKKCAPEDAHFFNFFWSRKLIIDQDRMNKLIWGYILKLPLIDNRISCITTRVAIAIIFALPNKKTLFLVWGKEYLRNLDCNLVSIREQEGMLFIPKKYNDQ